MANYLLTERYADAQVLAPSGGYTKGQLTLIEDTVGIIVSGRAGTGNDAGTFAEDTPCTFVFEAEKAVVTCTAAGAGDYPVGSLVAYDTSEEEIVLQEDDMDRDADILCGVVLEQPDTAATEVKIRLFGGWGREAQLLETDITALEAIIQNATAASNLLVYDENVAVGDIGVSGSGAVLLPALTGYHYVVYGYRLEVTGGALGAVTSIEVEDQASTPNSIVSVAAAAGTEDAIIGSHGAAISNVTPGTLPVTCDDDEAVEISRTGSAITTATHVRVQLQYTIVANS